MSAPNGKGGPRAKKVGISLPTKLVQAARESTKVIVAIDTVGDEPCVETVHLERCTTFLENHFKRAARSA